MNSEMRLNHVPATEYMLS